MNRPVLATVLAASLAVTAGACTGAQAHRVRRPAELTIGAGLAGVLVTSLVIAAAPAHKDVLIPVAAGFGAIAVGSAVVFGVAYANESVPAPPPPPPPPPDHRAEAWGITQSAQISARDNDCDTVRRLAAKVAELDASFFTVVFKRDVALARCLDGLIKD